ncbi:MAG: CvpA family protein [Ruminococcus sp.]|nr:CvpA family protein [Ruminococcus sp.]
MLYDLIFASIIIIAVVNGWRKGAAKSLLSLVAFSAAIVFAIFLARPLAQLIYTTFIKSSLESKIAGFIVESPAGAIAFEAAAFLASLPKTLLEMLKYWGTADQLTSGSASYAQSASTAVVQIENAVSPVIITVITGIVCVLLFIVLRLLLGFVAKGIAKIFRISLLKFPDSLLGGVLGLLKGAVVILALIVLLKLLYPILNEPVPFVYTGLGASQIASFIEEKEILSFLTDSLIYGI